MKQFLSACTLLFLSITAFSQAPGSGYALDFNASTDYVSIPNNPALNPTTSLTLEAWIKADSWSVNSWGNVIISKDGWGSGEAGYTLRCGANGTLSFMFGTTTSWKEALSTPQMALGTWYHVAGTYDGTRLTAYINGNSVGTFNYTGAMLASTYDLHIGKITYTAGGTRNFDGQIDEVRVWNTALPQATIQQWMTKKITSSHPNYANLAGNWRMDEGTGTTIADQSPNALTATRNGAPAWGLSAAAIGDNNAVVYGSPTTATVTNTDGSSFTAQINSGSPTGLHVYSVNQAPNTTNENLSGSLETTHYFGTFLVGGTNPNYSVTYNYTGVPGLTAAPQEQNIRLTNRNNNTGTLWSRLTKQFATDTLTNTIDKCGLTGRREFAAGFDSLLYNISNSTICQGDTLLYHGQTLTTAGFYTHTFVPSVGCDSTIGLNLSVTPSVLAVDSATICSGDSVVLGTQVLDSAGVYTETFAAANGCDSIVTFTLTVNPPQVTTIADTICDGDSYTLGSQIISQPGTYSETFSAITGCDSVVTLSLAIHHVDTSVTLSGNIITANLISPSYQWLNCIGFGAIPGATNQSFNVGFDGSYAVIVSDGICSDTSGCHFVLAIGIQDGWQSWVTIAPNPTAAQVQIARQDGNALGTLCLMTIDGRSLWAQEDVQATSTTLDLSQFAVGLYFLGLQVDGRMQWVKLMRK